MTSPQTKSPSVPNATEVVDRAALMWAIAKLEAFGVGSRNMEDATQLDRLKLMALDPHMKR